MIPKLMHSYDVEIGGQESRTLLVLFVRSLPRRTGGPFTSLNQWNRTVRHSQNERVPARIRESLQRPKLEQVGIVIHHSGSISQTAKRCRLSTSFFQRCLSVFLSLHNLREGFLHLTRKHDVLDVRRNEL